MAAQEAFFLRRDDNGGDANRATGNGDYHPLRPGSASWPGGGVEGRL